jgi:hypothetical protein
MNSPLLADANGERGFVLAQRIGGERALPTSEGLVLLSPQRLSRHMLVCGATGSGKTETLLRLAWTIAKTSSAPVFYLDGKGDRKTAERFYGLMADAGRECNVFPNEPFDGWRGHAHEIQGRLMEIVDYASDGPASWYRDVAKNVLGLVCEHPDGPPRSSVQALARMDIEALRAAHAGSSAIRALTKEQVRQVRLRYQAFFGQTQDATELLQAQTRQRLTLPKSWFVLDTPTPDAAVCGETLMLSRALLESEHLPAVLAHELGHLATPDGRLTAAINRLVILPPRPPRREQADYEQAGDRPQVELAIHDQRILLTILGIRLFTWILKKTLKFVNGGFGLWLTGPLWGAYWRRREYKADAYAAALGQADDLADFLENHALIHDHPVPYIWLTEHTHPPAELRIDKLRDAGMRTPVSCDPLPQIQGQPDAQSRSATVGDREVYGELPAPKKGRSLTRPFFGF